MSDGCSVPEVLRWLIKRESVAECAVCVVHDRAYYYGGSPEDRVAADEALRVGLIAAGMPAWKARFYWLGVRLGGMPYWRVKGVSWSFGGGHFRYEPCAAKPLAA